MTGVNDAPTLAAPDPLPLSDTAAKDTTFAALTGQLDADDVDNGAVLTYAIVGGTAGPNGSTTATSAFGTVTVQANGSYSFAPNAAAVNALGDDDNPTVSFALSVTDEHGASATTSLDVRINGENDAPEFTVLGGATTHLPIYVAPETHTAFISNLATDPDGDAVTYALTGSVVENAPFAIDTTTGALRFINPALTGEYTARVTATDSHGGSTERASHVVVGPHVSVTLRQGGSATDFQPTASVPITEDHELPSYFQLGLFDIDFTSLSGGIRIEIEANQTNIFQGDWGMEVHFFGFPDFSTTRLYRFPGSSFYDIEIDYDHQTSTLDIDFNPDTTFQLAAGSVTRIELL